MRKIIFLFIVAFVGVHAELLRLDECIDKALKTHPDVRTFVYETMRQHQRTVERKGSWLPQISAYAEYDPQRTYVIPSNGQFHTIDESGWSAGINVRQKIFDFYKTDYDIEASKIGEEISNLSLKDAQAMIRYRVKIAYIRLLVQKAVLRVRRKDLEVKLALYEQAKALVAQGLKTRADESRFLSSFRQAQDMLALAQASYRKATISLSQLIGRPISQSTTFEEKILENVDFSFSIEEKSVLENNLQLKIAQKGEEVSRVSHLSKKAQRYGSFDAVAEVAHFDTLSSYDTTLLGVRYTIPLYSGGKLSANVQQSRISKMIAAQRKESKRRAVLEETRELLADLDEIQKRIEARRSQAVAAEETRTLMKARYKEGLSTYVEVLDAEASWLDAKFGLLEAFYTGLKTLYRLEYLNGK